MEQQVVSEEQIITVAGGAIAGLYDQKMDGLPPETQRKIAAMLAIFFAQLSQDL